jgi:hypothetical protein
VLDGVKAAVKVDGAAFGEQAAHFAEPTLLAGVGSIGLTGAIPGQITPEQQPLRDPLAALSCQW